MKKTKKYLNRTSKRAKKRVKFLMRHPLLLPVSLFFVTVFFGLGAFVAVGATTEGAQDKRIVNVYVDGERQTVSTRAKTVGDLLDRLDVSLIEEDIVEPVTDSVILEDNTRVNIYRARPVSVLDNDRVITLLSAQRSPRLVASEAGLDLFPEDEASFVRETSNVLEESAGEQLVIVRSVPVNINIYGSVTQKRTTAQTVEDFLQENNIIVDAEATLQPEDITTPITEDMLIAINKVGIKTTAVTEAIAFDIETREDAGLEIGQSRVERSGVNGERTVIYEITETDGIEVARREIQSLVIKKPVNEIRIRGTKPATLSSSVSVSGDKIALMTAAGIAPEDFAYVDFIITKESNWRPGAINASGCIGLGQNCPVGGRLWLVEACPNWQSDPVCQLQRFSGYANSRYTSWQSAYNAWLAQNWW